MSRVTIAQEWLVSYGGSERCVEEMLATFPDAELLTTVLDPGSVPAVLHGARTSFLQHVPGARSHHEWLLPLMPLAWRMLAGPADVDVVISSSHACAKAVRIPEGVPHLCYCHTPMRYAWDFAAERERFPRPLRPAARAAMRWFRRWDRRTAESVTAFLANSPAVARRIERAYGRDARVVHPPVRTDFFTPGGERGGDFLYVGRLVGYKSAEVAVEAFRGLPQRLVVVGEGAGRRALEARAPRNVSFAGYVDEKRLRELYRAARALVHPANEDFGIAMAEAQACGTPVIGLAGSGADDIVVPGETGWLVPGSDPGAFRSAVVEAAAREADAVEIACRAQRFSAARFRDEIRAAVDELSERRRRKS